MIKRTRRAQRGTAIFMALLITAIVVTLTAMMGKIQSIDIHHTQMMLNTEQSYLYADAVEDWARGVLISQFNNPSTKWPMQLSPQRIMGDEGTISGTLQDAEGLINLNNYTTPPNAAPQGTTAPQGSITSQGANTALPSNPTSSGSVATEGGMTANEAASPATVAANAAAQASSQGNATAQANSKLVLDLFKGLNIRLNPDQFFKALANWIASPEESTDTFASLYAASTPPYRAPHLPMVGISELRMVAGMTAESYRKLLPFVVALPGSTTFNPQHASPELQKLLGVVASPGNAQTGQTGKYFLLRADVYYRGQHLVVYTLLTRTLLAKPKIIKIWKSLNTL